MVEPAVRPRPGRVPVPVYIETPRTNGLRKLNLPTLGATQAAADAAAAAAKSSPTSLSRGERSTSFTDAEPADIERTRYFRRLSTLPPALPHVPTMPKPVLKFVDATRGVLFALSQIYTAITQHTSVSTDERLVAHFHRVLGIASKSMSVLIHALDRLDATTRTSVPEAHIVRHVLEACHDAVRTFRRAVTMLHMQLPQLGHSVDPRFSRTLLLLLYGSVAELRTSAQVMEPYASDVVAFLEDAPASSPSSAVAAAADTSTSVWARGGTRPSHTEWSFGDTADTSSVDTTVLPASSTPLNKRTARIGQPHSAGRSPAVSPREPRKQCDAASPRTPLTPNGSTRMRMFASQTPSQVGASEDSLSDLLSQVTGNAMHIWSELRDYVQAGLRRGSDDNYDDTRTKRLHDVNESCASMIETTKRLQNTCDRIGHTTSQNASHADTQDLWEQSNQFVRVRMPCAHTNFIRPRSIYRR